MLFQLVHTFSWREKFSRKMTDTESTLGAHFSEPYSHYLHSSEREISWLPAQTFLLLSPDFFFRALSFLLNSHFSFLYPNTREYFPTCFFFSFIHCFSSCSFQSFQMCSMIVLLLVKYSIYLLIKTPFDLSTPYKNYRMQGI